MEPFPVATATFEDVLYMQENMEVQIFQLSNILWFNVWLY